MDDQEQKLDYDSDWISIRIRASMLQIVDSILLAEVGRLWERERDLLPHTKKKTSAHHWSYTIEELRTSWLGQALLTLADCAQGGIIEPEKVHRAMKRAARTLYGDPQRDDYTLPPQFHTTELGKLFHQTYTQLYTSREMLTAKQAYKLAGVARQTLYERRDRGKLTKIYWHDEIRFLRSEIEAWKAQRDQRQQEPTTAKEERGVHH